MIDLSFVVICLYILTVYPFCGGKKTESMTGHHYFDKLLHLLYEFATHNNWVKPTRKLAAYPHVMDMKESDRTMDTGILGERGYVDRLKKGRDDGLIRLARSRAWLFGALMSAGFLGIGSLVLHAYLVKIPDASLSNYHFIFGFAIALLCVPAVILFAVAVGKILDRVALMEDRPHGLLLKYHDMLLRKGIDPYKEESP